MIDRKLMKKTVDGLKCIWTWAKCGALRNDDFGKIMLTCDDAIKLLECLEPRVLSLEEYMSIADNRRSERVPVWTEWRGGGNRGWAIPQKAYEGYGAIWRAWTDRPTKKQMEAEKWL